jgi:glycosyltransferase involved in cell wall biosynthesis
MPAISVITPCFNGEPYLDALFESLRAQTYADFEHIVVDDGSTDASASVVERYMTRDARTALVRQANGGVARARARGYQAASAGSRYVYFLDVDDLLEPGMLEVMVGYLDAHPEVGLAYCAYTLIDGDARPLPAEPAPRYVKTRFGVREVPPDDPRTPLISIYNWAPVMESVSVMRRRIYDQTAGWDESIGQPGEGVDLFIQVAFLSEVHFVNRPLYRYRRHATQASNDLERLRRQDLRVQTKWRDQRNLPQAFRAQIDEAQAFRTGRLKLHHSLRSAAGYFRRGEMRHGAKCAIASAQTAWRMIRRESPWPQGLPT